MVDRCSLVLCSTSDTAYWIAFGPHGPRKLPEPGENWKVAGWTLAGIGISLALFVVIRMFARGPPETMTKEYQEATNEYLKVRTHVQMILSSLTHLSCLVSKRRPHLGYILRRLRRQRSRTEQAQEISLEGWQMPRKSRVVFLKDISSDSVALVFPLPVSIYLSFYPSLEPSQTELRRRLKVVCECARVVDACCRKGCKILEVKCHHLAYNNMFSMS